MRRARLVLCAAVAAACTGGGSGGPEVPGGDPARGIAAMQKYGCEFCHHVPGIEGRPAIVAPPLTNWAERRYIAGALPNLPEHLVRWIVDPHSVEPGTAMPTLGVSEAEARDIAAYLFTLGEPAAHAPADTFPVRLD